MQPEAPGIAVASRSFSETAELRSALEAHFSRVRFNDSGKTLRGQELVDFLQGMEAAIVGLEVIEEELLARVPCLRVISKYGVGLNNVDLRACARAGVEVLHTPGVNSYSVAELALSSAIQLLHRTPESQRARVKGEWTQHRGRDLRGSVVGVVGCGHVGKQLVQLLSPFECHVLAYDKVDYRDFYAEWGVTATTLPRLLAESDVISIHLPLDPSTAGMFSSEVLELIKPGAVLLNYARGGIIDEACVAELLREGRLSGLAIDVFAVEPPVGAGLSEFDTVLSTCHIGGSTSDAVLAMGRAAIEQLLRVYPPKD